MRHFTGLFVLLFLSTIASAQPLIYSRGVVNAASNVPNALPGGGIARGSIITIYGANIGPASGVQAPTFPLGNSLAGVTIQATQGTTTVDVIPLYVSSGQINALMPSNTPLGQVSLRLTYNNVKSNPLPVRVVNTSVGIVSVSGGIGAGAFQNFISSDNQPINTPKVTAKPGQVITAYATGLGPVATDNVQPTAGNLPTKVEVTVGGKDAKVLYSGRTPCCAGEDQIVFQVPDDAPSGCWVPVYVRTDNAVTSNAVTMAIDAEGQTCSQDPLTDVFVSGGKAGILSLVRTSIHQDLNVSVVTDNTSDDFVFNLAQHNGGSFALYPPAGSCTLVRDRRRLAGYRAAAGNVKGGQGAGRGNAKRHRAEGRQEGAAAAAGQRHAFWNGMVAAWIPESALSRSGRLSNHRTRRRGCESVPGERDDTAAVQLDKSRSTADDRSHAAAERNLVRRARWSDTDGAGRLGRFAGQCLGGICVHGSGRRDQSHGAGRDSVGDAGDSDRLESVQVGSVFDQWTAAERQGVHGRRLGCRRRDVGLHGGKNGGVQMKRAWMLRLGACGLMLAVCSTPAAAQGVGLSQPPPDNWWQNNVVNPIWDLSHGYERHTTCYDYCAGKQPRSKCTTRVIKNTAIDVTHTNGQVVSMFERDFPYPQNPNWKCDYDEGNPGGVGIMSAVPSYQDIVAPPSSELGALSAGPVQPRDVGATIPGPFLNLPFPPIYLSDSAPAPQGCTPLPGRDVFFVNHDLDTVVRARACGGDVIAVIPVGSLPLKIALTPDNLLALVTMYDGGVAYIDTATNQVIFTLATPFNVHPSGIAITPDGKQAYITNYFDITPSVLVIDIAQRKILNTITVTAYPQSVYFTPDGSQAWVTFPFANAIYVIDTFTQTIGRTIGIQFPYGLAFNSTGTRAYIASQGSPGTVKVYDTATFQPVGSYTVGAGPVDVSISNDDQLVFVTNGLDGSISVIDLPNGTVQTTPTADHPRGLVQVE